MPAACYPECWPPFIIPARSSNSPLILSVAQLLCWLRPADQLPLAFFKACFNCKEQSLVTEQNIPCLFIDSPVREQRQLKESSFRVLRCSPIRGTKGEEIKGTAFPVPSGCSSELRVQRGLCSCLLQSPLPRLQAFRECLPVAVRHRKGPLRQNDMAALGSLSTAAWVPKRQRASRGSWANLVYNGSFILRSSGPEQRL